MNYLSVSGKRKRERPVRKWSDDEISNILDYIVDHGPGSFETPTAQIFYKRLLEVLDIDASWDLLKFKMRYLRKTHTKAKDWCKTTEAGIQDDVGMITVKGDSQFTENHKNVPALRQIFNNISCGEGS